MQKNILNTKKAYLILLLAVIFIPSNIELYSQKLDSPISPVQRVVKDWELGAFAGFGANFSSGEYLPECPDCVFDDNSKFGWTFGLKSDWEITPHFYFGTNLLLDGISTRGSFLRYEDVQLQRTDGTYFTAPIEFRHILNLDVTTLGIVPNAVWRVDRWLDLRLGFYGDLALSGNITHDKELLTEKVLLSDGEQVKVSIPGEPDGTKTIEDREIPELNTLQFGLFPQINFNIPLNKDNEFLIGYFMKFPLNDLSSQQPGYKHITWRLFLGISFDLNKDVKNDNLPIPSDRK
ncbi:MAG: hypothetical protein A2X64_03335 [Ignavibacteria bacterium GWF2_33_9]|nr:MAG: hypothetical protein A2X64_03335 [Ignavibacteria bacterium GWF2_33_9]